MNMSASQPIFSSRWPLEVVNLYLDSGSTSFGRAERASIIKSHVKDVENVVDDVRKSIKTVDVKKMEDIARLDASILFDLTEEGEEDLTFINGFQNDVKLRPITHCLMGSYPVMDTVSGLLLSRLECIESVESDSNLKNLANLLKCQDAETPLTKEDLEFLSTLYSWRLILKSTLPEWSKAPPLDPEVLKSSQYAYLYRHLLARLVLSDMENGKLVMPAFPIMEQISQELWQPRFYPSLAASFYRMSHGQKELCIGLLNHPGLRPLPSPYHLELAMKLESSLPGYPGWVERGWKMNGGQAYKQLVATKVADWQQAPELYKWTKE